MSFKTMRFGANLARRSGLLSFVQLLETYRGDLLRILVYHRIGYPEAESGLLDPSLLSATPEQFSQQMRFLREHYRLLSIRDLLQAIETKEPLPSKSVMVTFDDGYHDFLETAWPILKQNQIPTLMFLATGFLSLENQLFWWDRLYQGISKTNCTILNIPSIGDFPLENKIQRWDAFIELKKRISCMEFYFAMQHVDRILEILEVIPKNKGFLMNWSDARWLNEQGCYLAAHTQSHSILSRISKEKARQEIHESIQDVRREIGTAWPAFAYPAGHSQDCGEDLSLVMREEGLKIVMSSIPGINLMSRSNLLRLKRTGLSPRLSLPEFQLVLTGVYHFYNTIQNLFTPL